MSFVYLSEPPPPPPEKPFEPKYLELGKKYLMLVAFDWDKEKKPGKFLVEYVGIQRNGGRGFKLIKCFNKEKDTCKKILDKFKTRGIINKEEIIDDNINYSNIIASIHSYHTLSNNLIKETAIEYENDINAFSEQDELKDFIKRNKNRIGDNPYVYRLFVTFFTYSDELHNKLKNTVFKKLQTTADFPSDIIDYQFDEFLTGKKSPKKNSSKKRKSSIGGRKNKRKTRHNKFS